MWKMKNSRRSSRGVQWFAGARNLKDLESESALYVPSVSTVRRVRRARGKAIPAAANSNRSNVMKIKQAEGKKVVKTLQFKGETFSIEAGVPIPSRRGEVAGFRDILLALKDGHSVVLPVNTTRAANIAMSAFGAGNYVTRKEAGNQNQTRVWRGKPAELLNGEGE